jgi:effector-binding domain-containing protein
MIETIGIETVTARTTAVVRGHARAEEIGPLVGQAYAEVGQALTAQGLFPAGPPFVRYAREGMGPDEFDLAAGFPCTRAATAAGRVEPMELPGGDAVVADHQVDDLDDLVLGQLVEHDDVVDAVEELGPEVLLELVVDLVFIRS